MDQTGPFSSASQPLVGKADWILLGLIGLCGIAAEVFSYGAGFYGSSGKWFLGSLACFYAAFALWVTLLCMPLINRHKDKQALRLSIRAGLMILAIGLFCLPSWFAETPSYVRGSQEAFSSVLTESDFNHLRATVAEKLKQQPDLLLLPPEGTDLPQAFQRLNRPLPNYIDVRSSSTKAPEIVVEWGGPLVGRHGLVIDPLEIPVTGRAERSAGGVQWHFMLAKGVYFYASSE